RAYLSRAPLCDQVHCQVYRGLSGVRPSIQDAVRATEGQVALFDGQVIEAVYSSDCGGHTEANDDAWGGRPAPYLRPVPDGPEGSAGHYCAVSQRHEWNVRVSPARLRALVGGTEAVLAVELAERTATGKVRRVRVRYRTSDGEVREKSYTGVQWQKLVGAGQVLGLKYTLRLTDGGLEIEGRGWGHGVGLCQHGAQGMARQGRSTPQILRHYYSGIELGSLPALSELAISQMEQRRRDWVAAWGGAAPVLLRSPIGASPAGILAAPALEPVEKKRERVAEAPVTPVTPRMRPAPTARPRTAAVPDSSAAPTAGRAAAVRLSLSRTTAASANRAAGVQLSRVGALRRRFLRPDVARQAASDRVTLASSARRSTGRRSRAQAEGE
ncbi:MAG: SpoIID/LytB domain-containing protein, partial [Armatimonadetes bacterium]|nr:SpoIID/LytB domain-containing protein [Armatimonadota bacterium]